MAIATTTTNLCPHVSIPAMRIGACDLLDGALDQFRTIHAALNPDNKGALDDDTLFSIWAAIGHAMNDLDALRNHMNNRS